MSAEPPAGRDGFPTEAWLSDVTRSGVPVVQQEDAGYSGPDAITAVALDRDALFTVRLRDEPPDELVRIPLGGGPASATRIGGSLPVAVARDRDRVFVVDAVDEGRRSVLVEYRSAG